MTGAATIRPPDSREVMAQARAENFPVASRLLPRRTRSHLLALYGFARLVDDVGDQARGDRLALLDELESDLEQTWQLAAGHAGSAPRQPLIAALQPTIADCELPVEPFRRLIEANRRDQLKSRYETFDELLEYCSLSANPVGELVLRILGGACPERLARSDPICTGLQLVEHWQDVGEDHGRGRIYVPTEDRERFHVAEQELGGRRATPEFRRLMAFEVARARELLDRGAPLVGMLRGRAALAVAAFVAGGRSALGAIERAEYDVLGARPRPGRALKASAMITTLVRGGRGGDR